MAGRRSSRDRGNKPPPTVRAGRARRLVLSILIGLVLLEGGLRILLGNFGQSQVLQRSDNAEICLELRPETQQVYTGWRQKVAPSEMIINSHGFRGPELKDQKPEGTLRLAALGDSFTFGQGVDYAQSFPAVAGEALRGAGIKTEVLNFGVPGHSTPQSVALARERVAPLDPDVVLLHVFANDLSAAESYCHYGQGGNAATAWVLRNVYVGRLLYLLASPLLFGEVDPADYPDLGTPPERFVESIQALQALGREQGFLVAVVLLTDRSMFLEQRFCPNCVPAHDLVGKTDAHVIDLSAVWEDLQGDIPGNFITGEDHFTPAGNARMGAALAEALQGWDELSERARSRGGSAP